MPSAEIAAAKPVKDWHPDHFHTRHILACRMHASGMKNKEIAQALDLSESRVSIILNDPRAAEHIREFAGVLAEHIHEEVLERIQLAAPEMLDIVIDIAKDEDVHPSVRSRNAFDLLDRAGYGAIEKSMVLEANISQEVSDRLERSLEQSDEIDADYTIEDADPEDDEEDSS